MLDNTGGDSAWQSLSLENALAGVTWLACTGILAGQMEAKSVFKEGEMQNPACFIGHIRRVAVWFIKVYSGAFQLVCIWM